MSLEPLPFERERAACFPPPAGVTFFPSTLKRGDQWTARKQADAARAVCKGCEVRSECLEYALSYGVTPVGVWGGFYFRDNNGTSVKAEARAWLAGNPASSTSATPMPMPALVGGNREHASAPSTVVMPLDEMQAAHERARQRAFEPPPAAFNEVFYLWADADAG